MSTIHFPQIPKISEEEIREATFTFSRWPLNSTETEFVKEGFWKRADGSVECHSCGTLENVIFDSHWTLQEIAKLHKPDCEVQRENLEYICRQHIWITTRIPRGTNSFSCEVIQEALSFGFCEERIIKAAIDFFVKYGAFPEIGDLMEFITRG